MGAALGLITRGVPLRTGRSRGGSALAADSFGRANNASTMGTTETGGLAWTPEEGTWGISANRAYRVVSGAGGGWLQGCVVNAGRADCTVEVDYTTPASGAFYGGIRFRQTSRGDAWSFHLRSDGWLCELMDLQAEVNNVRGSFGTPASNGTTYRLKVVLSGNSISCYVDGVLVFSHTSAFNNTATRHGFGSYHTGDYNERWDNWRVTP